MPEERSRKRVAGVIPTLARLTMIGWFVGVSVAGGVFRPRSARRNS